MNLRTLLPLVIIFVLLVVIAIFQKRWQGPARFVDEAGLTALPSATIKSDEIRGIDLHYGATREKAVRLRRQGKRWVAIDYFRAPVQQEKIDTLLQALVRLQGELRSDQAELLTDFALETGQAYHLRIFTRSFDQSAVHLLIGKRKNKVGFVRQQDDPRVYSVRSELFNVLGIWLDQTGQPPTTKSWLDLQVQNILEHAVESFALRTPQRTWEFKRVMPSGINQTGVTPKPDDQPRWVLANPAVELSLQQNRVEGILATLRTLRADDITASDSDQLAGYGLLNPDYVATVVWRSKDDRLHSTTISIGQEHPQLKRSRYARQGQSGPVYILSNGDFKRLFPNPQQFLALPALGIQPDALRHITLTSAGRTVQFERDNSTLTREAGATRQDQWRLSYPPVDFELRQDAFDKWIQQLTTFSPEALAPESFKPDPEQTVIEASIEVVQANETRNSLRFGVQIDGYPQHYALFFNAISTPFAISQTTRQRMLPRLKDLVMMQPLKFDLDNIKEVSWNIGNGVWRIARSNQTPLTEEGEQGSSWQFVHPEPEEIDPKRLQAILQVIADITADDWYESMEREVDEEEQHQTVSLTFRDHRIVKMMLIKREHSSGITYSHLPGIFILSKAPYTTLLDSLKALESAHIPLLNGF